MAAKMSVCVAAALVACAAAGGSAADAESVGTIPQPKSFNCTTQPEGTFDPIVLKNGDISAT